MAYFLDRIPDPPTDLAVQVERSDDGLVFSGRDETRTEGPRLPPQFRAMLSFGRGFITFWKAGVLLITGGGAVFMLRSLARIVFRGDHGPEAASWKEILLRLCFLLAWIAIGVVMWFSGRRFSRQLAAISGAAPPRTWRLTLTPTAWTASVCELRTTRKERFSPDDVQALELSGDGTLVATLFAMDREDEKRIVVAGPLDPQAGEWLQGVLRKQLRLTA